jgi:gluconolactonase
MASKSEVKVLWLYFKVESFRNCLNHQFFIVLTFLSLSLTQPSKMKKLFFSVLLSPFFSFGQQTIGRLVSSDPAFDALVDPSAKIEVLGEGYKWSEGPAWVKNGEFLLFSDVPNNVIHKWKEGEGVSVFLKPSGYTGVLPYSNEPGSNGLIINQKGELVACEHGDRRVSAMPLILGGKRTLSDNCQGKRFNSPNDVCQHSNGDYFFTDPPYGLPQYEKDPSRETQVFGVYHLNAKTGLTQLIIKDLSRPNGICFSPDEKTLYVAQSDPEKAVIMAYTVLPNGKVGKGSVLFDATVMVKQGLKGLPDGLRTDLKGNIFSTGPGGVLVISPQGKLLGRIDTDQPTANCAFGPDGYLYMTANMFICRIKTKTQGKF